MPPAAGDWYTPQTATASLSDLMGQAGEDAGAGDKDGSHVLREGQIYEVNRGKLEVPLWAKQWGKGKKENRTRPLIKKELAKRMAVAKRWMEVRDAVNQLRWPIRDGSIVVVDRSVAPRKRDLVVMDHHGERVIGRMPPADGGEYLVWGKVTAIVTRL